MKAINILFCFLMLASCSSGHKELTKDDFMHWVDDKNNGLYQEKTIDKMRFELKYKPADYMIAQEMRSGKVDRKNYDESMSRFSDYDYFNLRISAKEANVSILRYQLTDENEYYTRKEYFTFGFEKDIYLVDGDKKVPCTIFHFEDTYELSKYETFVIGFPKSAEKGPRDKTVVIDTDVFNTGPVKFTFTKELFKNIPNLVVPQNSKL